MSWSGEGLRARDERGAAGLRGLDGACGLVGLAELEAALMVDLEVLEV